VTAGQIWRRPGGLVWVEVQAGPVDPSGWRLMVPLVDPDTTPPATPLVVTVGRWRARVHLVTSVPTDGLGELDGQLTDGQVADLQAAVRRLVT